MVDCACIVSVVSPVLQVAEWLAAPTWRQFKYLFNYTTNFKNLEDEVKKLEYTRDEVQRKVTAAERKLEEIKQNVKDWQKDVEKSITEAEQLIQAKANNPRCFKGLCPNFLIHYKQSKKAFKLKRDDIDLLLQREKEWDTISNPPPDPLPRPNKDYVAFESRNSIVTNVWEALKNENVYMIGVYGMGGLGKTTLVQELRRKATEEKKPFTEIVFVEVSESPDVKKIQTTIAEELGPEFKQERKMADKIYSRMKDKNILLILDNIWEPLQFEQIGIPCEDDRGRNKLLFTTRDLNVLNEMGCTNNFRIDILNEEEAWTLFTKMTGNIIQTRELHSLQNDVCKECGGLPLVISAIAKALRNKSDPSNWKCALQDLQGLSTIGYTRSLKKEYTQIALSYNYLSDELKKTFLICSLMENNTSISDLFKNVVCLNILGGVNLPMEDARVRLNKLVHDLKDACLLLDGVKSGQFAMHDVIRDVAITFAHVEHYVFTTRNDVERDWKDTDKLKKCMKISLPGKNTIISQLWPNNLDCPNLEYFYMTDMWDSSFKFPKDFFKVMPKLRVLNLVQLQQLPLPSSIHQLTNLQTLCLDYSNIKDIAIIGKLKNLKVLSLRDSYIKEFSTEMGQLTQLRLLDLSNCYHLKVIALNVISKLFNLEELYLKGCPIQWKIEVLEELKRLSKLASVELDIQDDKVLPEAFFSRELIRYKILVGNWRYQYLPIGKHECLRILKLIFSHTIYLEELCGIKNVELLCLVECSNDEYEDEDDEDEDEDDLEHSKFNLQSSEITPLFNKKVIFSDLKVLVLKNIISRKIWDNQLPSSSFQNLKELILWRCTKIKFVFPYTITKNLQQLQYLEIKDCIDLEEIVAIEEITEAAASFVFPEVTFLELENLPELAAFYPGIHTLEWPKLKWLAVKDCDKFNMLNSEPNSLCLDHKINHDLELFVLKTQSIEICWNRNNKALDISSDESAYIPLPVLQRFQSLERLQLYKCEYNEIKSVFDLPNLNVLGLVCCQKLVSPVPSSPSTARSLVQLKELCISNCGMLDVTTIEIVFQKWTKLSFYQLKSRTCFCSGNHSLNFPSLKELIISYCSNMDTFFREISNVSEFTLQSNEITPFFNQKVYFCDLEVLKLENISSEKIWDSQLSTSSYQNLTHLTLCECDKIKYVFPLSIAKSLQQLQYLELKRCKVLERIVAPEEGTEVAINFFFPQISTVKLQYLPEFTDFYPGIHTSEWPKLKELMIDRCGKFKMLTSEPNFLCFDQKINHDLEIFQVKDGREQISWWSQLEQLRISYYKLAPIPLWLLQRFENLRCLFVRGCHELVNITTLLTARSLVQLGELKISRCKMLLEILEIEEDATTEIVFENLSKLSFANIKSLICFCSGNYTFNFP